MQITGLKLVRVMPANFGQLRGANANVVNDDPISTVAAQLRTGGGTRSVASAPHTVPALYERRCADDATASAVTDRRYSKKSNQ